MNGDYANLKPAALKVRIGNHYLDKFGISYIVAGDVINTGTDTTSYTEVDGIFYDKQGRVIDVTSTCAPQSDLNPGQSTPFELAGSLNLVPPLCIAGNDTLKLARNWLK